jgi:hypothetical protein
MSCQQLSNNLTTHNNAIIGEMEGETKVVRSQSLLVCFHKFYRCSGIEGVDHSHHYKKKESTQKT